MLAAFLKVSATAGRTAQCAFVTAHKTSLISNSSSSTGSPISVSKSAQLHAPLMFHHGIPIAQSAVARRFADAVFSDATIERVPGGLFATIKLAANDPLESAIAKMISRGAVRFSTGSTTQFARRQGSKSTRWPVVELSVTPRPAEQRLPKIRPLP